VTYPTRDLGLLRSQDAVAARGKATRKAAKGKGTGNGKGNGRKVWKSIPPSQLLEEFSVDSPIDSAWNYI
jgi:hypothetical protein